ncbi:hypothetical protein OIE68_46485 [Nocardia vinacea]|uniref:PE domain-containing protein n=1 Tax=Nocardia vinacea TaxID=96468 RepID=A0ABZ1YLK6_9NOCA|nr:hypothetical protein OIE68_46485 [Nocardia vinacea]
MSAESTTPSSAGPLASAIKDAQDGKLTVSFSNEVRVNADEFVYIERDCEAFKEEIRYLQRIAENISRREHWGLGETTDGMTSASTLVARFRGKAKIVNPATDSSNNVHDILEQHYQIVDDIQNLHRTIAQKYVGQDQEFAARYNELKANVEPSQIGTPTQLSVISAPAVGASK